MSRDHQYRQYLKWQGYLTLASLVIIFLWWRLFHKCLYLRVFMYTTGTHLEFCYEVSLNLSKLIPCQSGWTFFTCLYISLFLNIKPQGGHLYFSGLWCTSFICLLMWPFWEIVLEHNRQTNPLAHTSAYLAINSSRERVPASIKQRNGNSWVWRFKSSQY